MTEREKKLLRLLKYAFENLTFLDWQPGLDEEYQYCKVCSSPEWNHDEDCAAVEWEKQVKAILEEG